MRNTVWFWFLLSTNVNLCAVSNHREKEFAWLTSLLPLSFPQIVAEVGGKTKTRPSFDCGSDSTSTSSNRGTKMPTRRGSNWKNDPKLKTGSKKQSLSPSKRSVVFPVDEVSFCHRPAEPAEQFSFPVPDTIYPPTQVNYCLCGAFFTPFFTDLRWNIRKKACG